MELELKHIAPYLPYGLEVEILNYLSDSVGVRYSELIGFYPLGTAGFHFHYAKEQIEKISSNIRKKPVMKAFFDKQLTRSEFLLRMELLRFSRIEQAGINAAKEIK